jgi:hypothetical protein
LRAQESEALERLREASGELVIAAPP